MSAKLGIDLYVVVDKALLGGRSATSILRAILGAGVKWIQYRDKQSSDEHCAEQLAKIVPLCRAEGAKVIVNDRAWLVEQTGVDGVHLGLGDMRIGEVRRLLGEGKIVGASARTVDDASGAEREGADYLGVGSIYPSTTKEDSVVVGLSRLTDISSRVTLPVVAIGGIGLSNVAGVLKAGATGIAVSSAVLNATDAEGAARNLLQKIWKYRKES
jgi:thiamine-phosphate diphosphorylase